MEPLSLGTIRKVVRLAAPDRNREGRQALDDEGYGVIRGSDGRDVFFVGSVVSGCAFRDLYAGQSVRFVREEGPLARARLVEPTPIDAAVT